MRRAAKEVSITDVLQHLLAGAGLGLFLGLSLTNGVAASLIASQSSPRASGFALVAVSCATIGVSSAITGFLLTAIQRT
jgi:hypothetical protein